MTDETELNELRERIGKLNSGAQVRLLELVLGDNRRRREEVRASNLAAEAALLEWERNQAEARRAAG